mgnify:FL=1
MDIKNISIYDYTYHLPAERIAAYPLAERDASKLLVYNQGTITETAYRQIDEQLPADSLLILNNTKVVEARLHFQKPTGGVIEIFCLEPHPQYGDITSAMQQRRKVLWICLIGGASKWKAGQVLEKHLQHHDQPLVVRARYVGKEQDAVAIELQWEPADLSFAEILHYAGMVPLPPYIKREADASDAERYQTIYAQAEGSVAAPTAGLHFTPAIFSRLAAKNVLKEEVTLHVGAGTFKPVKSETLQHHEMHAEFIEVSATAIERILQYLPKHITVVGTTSMRTVESLYWLGVKAIVQPGLPPQAWELHQWDAYELDAHQIPVDAALQAVLHKMQTLQWKRLITRTRLLIGPGYRFRIAKALVTNFHQPQSTLLLLVAAFVGEDWRKIYDYALQNNFRFLSYGDGCLLFGRQEQ